MFASIGKFIHREFAAAWPVFLFFMVGFMLLLLLIKLALANFSIGMTALSNAVVGALFAAKAALILDETPLARPLEYFRRIVAVAVKTFFYGAITLLLGYLERILEALHREHGLGAAVQYRRGGRNRAYALSDLTRTLSERHRSRRARSTDLRDTLRGEVDLVIGEEMFHVCSFWPKAI